MILYLDASLLVPIFAWDVLNEHADRVLREWRDTVVISDFAALEFASALARRVRAGDITDGEAQIAISNFDGWSRAATDLIRIDSGDIAAAEALIRRFDLPLRTGDAIHVAVAQRLGATLATFDRQMARSAEAVDIAVKGLTTE